MLLILLLDPHWEGLGSVGLVFFLVVLAVPVGLGMHLWGLHIARQFDHEWTEAKAREAAAARWRLFGRILGALAVVVGLIALMVWTSG